MSKKKIVLLEPLPDFKEFVKFGGPFVKLHEQTVDRAKGPDTEIVHRTCPPGFWKAAHTTIDYFMDALEVPSLCKQAIEAEKEGADAVIVVCTCDPGVRFMRQIVDIPVIAEFESALHMACMMGHKFGVLSWPLIPYMTAGEEMIRAYGLESHAVHNPIEPVIEPGPRSDVDLVRGYADPKAFVEKHFIPAGQRLIKRGAEAIVMHSTGLSLMVENAGLRKIEAGDMPGVPKGAAVPVLDVVTIAIKMAEVMIDLRRLGVPSVGRTGLYQKVQQNVKEDDFKQIREYFEKDWVGLPIPEMKKK